MNSSLFVRILKFGYMPFAMAAYGNMCRLQMDNAPPHTSRFTRNFLNEKKLSVLNWPAESPDLNVIECVWHQLKEWIRTKAKPHNLFELKKAILTFWKTFMTPQQCLKYINHIHRVIPEVLAANGGPTTH